MAEVYCGIDASPLSATVCVTVRALMENTEYALQTSLTHPQRKRPAETGDCHGLCKQGKHMTYTWPGI